MNQVRFAPAMHAVFAAVRAAPMPVREGTFSKPSPPVSFVTISREGGAGGRAIGQRLVERLNQLDPGEEPWTLWDGALVEKVSADHHIAAELVESLGDTHHGWMEEFLRSLSQVGDIDEAKIYRRVAVTIRALAHRGRAVIVGRGGMHITRQMPGGVHIRLVATFENRVAFMMRQHGMAHEAAAEHVRELDRNRQAFYRRYWPKAVLDEDVFTLTLNTGTVGENRVVECLLPLILPVSCVTATDDPNAAVSAMA